MRASDIPEISTLSTAEKILLVEELWDDIAANDGEVPVPASHKEELNRRLERHKSNPDDLLSMDELRARLERT
jgi:putative addiction module component (TIGR02574 family)